MDNAGPESSATLYFGPFRLLKAQRRLWRGDEEVQLGGRAFDILAALVERAGSVVSQRELIDRAWPGLFVEDANLRVHIATLRKALGDGEYGAHYIETVPRRGYCFVAPLTSGNAAEASAQAAPQPDAMARPRGNLPGVLGRMIGRDAAVGELVALVHQHRFVTIVGTGGLGKTTVALAVAHALREDFRDEVVFVDLGTISRGDLVDVAIAAAFGIDTRSGAVVGELLAALRNRRVLLLLDSCEHVIEAIAPLAERLFAEIPALYILATSRETMRVEGENTYLLPSLESPPLRIALTAEEAMSWASVQLFMERAAAQGYRTRLSDDEAPIVAEICHRLDGIALAIELAAGRVATHGIAGTGDLLNYRFKLLWQGRRSAIPRHQTMSAMVDWSYGLLTEHERTVLARLSILVGPFSIATAEEIARDDRIARLQVAEILSSLADKSLLASSISPEGPTYRLLDMTRTYAGAKLEESGELAVIARRHAALVLERISTDGQRRPSRNTPHGGCETNFMGNLRPALEWSFSPDGDRRLAVELAAASVPLLLRLSLLRECEQWCTRGLAIMDETERGGPMELALREGLAVATMFMRGNRQETRAILEEGVSLAGALGALDVELRLVSGLHLFDIRVGNFPSLIGLSLRAVDLAATIGNNDAQIIAEWMLGTAYHLNGDQANGQIHCERALSRSLATGLTHLDAFGYDHRIRGLIVLVRVLALRGSFERAARLAEDVVAEAELKGQAVALCIALIYTTTASLWAEDANAAEGRVERLIEVATVNALEPYRAVGLAMRAEIAISRGHIADGIAELRNAIAILEAERHRVTTTNFLRALAEALAANGQNSEAMAVIDHTLAGAAASGESYMLPDLHRARGEILKRAGASNFDAAEDAFRTAVALARDHGTRGWELRATRGLASLLAERGRDREAVDLLKSGLEGFEESARQPVVRSTRALLESIETAMAAHD